jgi:hypothetical protein
VLAEGFREVWGGAGGWIGRGGLGWSGVGGEGKFRLEVGYVWVLGRWSGVGNWAFIEVPPRPCADDQSSVPKMR